MTPAKASARGYDSSRRREAAAATRAGVIGAAARLFAERGWVGTSMRDIAKAAGVSVETVYSSVGSKADVLREAIIVNVLGDDEPVPLEDRAEFRAMADGTPAERARAAADLIGTIMPRTAPLIRVLEHAALADPALAEMRLWGLGSQRDGLRRALCLMARQEPTEQAVAAMQAVLTEPVYLYFTEIAGWSNEAYRAWVADTLLHLFLREEHCRDTHHRS